MEEIILETHVREEQGKDALRSLRRSQFIPAVVYGEGKKTQLLKIENRVLLRHLREHRAESTILTLRVIADGKTPKDIPAIVKEIQHDPVKDNIIHVDFNWISLTKAIKVKVPIEAKGESVGIKLDGGSLEHILWDLEIECLPTQIPEKFVVDISALKIGDSVHVKDLSVPSGVKVLHEPDAVVLSIAAPVKEVVAEAPVEGAEPTEPEVLKEKKEKPEAAAGEEAPKKEEKEKPKKE